VEGVARLTDQERRELFSETASRRSTTPAVIEKDFWVTRTLGRLFQHEELARILMFKGGTSLSKVYDVIERFSEDIDLILDWSVLSDEDPLTERSGTKQAKFNQVLNERAHQYIRNELLRAVQSVLGEVSHVALDGDDPYVINVGYPAAFPDDYLRPEIRLEIGPLAAWLPHEEHAIRSYTAEAFPDQFTHPECNVNVIAAERTFWEKATILHHEAHRPEGSSQPSRYSRHYYDLARLAQAEIKDKALQDLELLESVVAFKQKFYPRGWARYDLARPGTLRLVPTDHVLASVEQDYRAMGNMIFGEIPSFDEIMSNIGSLELEINVLGSD
jgi:predicted nucleotidyltransferase component of viral defense system